MLESAEPPTPLRIALLDSWAPSSHEGSGTAVGVRGLALGLARIGHDVVTLAPRAGRAGGAMAAEAGAARLPGRLLFNAGLPRRIRAEGPFDLIVGVDIDGFRWAGRGAVRPGYVVALKGVAADEARYERGWDRRRLGFLGALERRNARGASRVVVPSRYSAGVVARAYGVEPPRITVVPEAIDLDRWPRVERRTGADGDGPLTILSVARQYPRKDTATLVRAMPIVLEGVPGARLRVIGGGPELGRLEALARELGVARAVRFDGPIPDDAQVRRAYLEADVFCLPSLQEGFGIVFLEAMAAGLPVVAARAGAVPEVVTDGRTGVLVAPGDPRALAAALVGLLESPGLRRDLGTAGRARVQDFDVGPVARRFVESAAPTRPSAVPTRPSAVPGTA